MTAVLCVVSTVDPAVAEEFDRWYESEHIPDARRLLHGIGRVSRWRCTTTPHQVTTVYEFADAQQVHAALESEAIQTLISEFDRRWKGRVVRERSAHQLVYSTTGGG